jgi:curved DNA-binding protein CbpA
MINYYKLLGISENASQEELKTAYRKKIKENHPDLFQAEKEKILAGDKTKKIIDASWYVECGQKYESKCMHDQAIADFTQAIKLDPNNQAAYLERFSAYKEKGDPFRAALDYAKINEFIDAFTANRHGNKKKVRRENSTDRLSRMVSVGRIIFNIFAGDRI